MATKAVSESSILPIPLTGFTILDMPSEILALFCSYLSISHSSRLLTTCKLLTEGRFVEPIAVRFRTELQGEANQFFSCIPGSIGTLPWFKADVRNAICGFELLRAQRTQKHISIIAFRMFSSAEFMDDLAYFKEELKDCRFHHFTDTFSQPLEVSEQVQKLRLPTSIRSRHYYSLESAISEQLLKGKYVFEAAEITMGFKLLADIDGRKLIRGFCDEGCFWRALEFPEELLTDLQESAYEELLTCLIVYGHPAWAIELADRKKLEESLINSAFTSAYLELMNKDRFPEAFSIATKLPDPKKRKWLLNIFINTLTSPHISREKQFFTEAISYTLQIEDEEVRESCFKAIEYRADSETKQKVADARNSSKR